MGHTPPHGDYRYGPFDPVDGVGRPISVPPPPPAPDRYPYWRELAAAEAAADAMLKNGYTGPTNGGTIMVENPYHSDEAVKEQARKEAAEALWKAQCAEDLREMRRHQSDTEVILQGLWDHDEITLEEYESRIDWLVRNAPQRLKGATQAEKVTKASHTRLFLNVLQVVCLVCIPLLFLFAGPDVPSVVIVLLTALGGLPSFVRGVNTIGATFE